MKSHEFFKKYANMPLKARKRPIYFNIDHPFREIVTLADVYKSMNEMEYPDKHPLGKRILQVAPSLFRAVS